MAAELQTPLCEVSGLPLLIYPSEPPKGALFLHDNLHHPQHPNKAPELEETPGRAVRYSGGEEISQTLHENYHWLFRGPPLPATKEDKFRVTVMQCAGVIPRKAIDVSKHGEYRIVTLTDEEFERMSAPRRYHVEGIYKDKRSLHTRREIGKFFTAYALEQNIRQVVSDSVIDQFLDHKTKPERKKELGNFILTKTLDLSVAELRPVMRELKKEGLISIERRRSLNEILRKFVNKRCLPAYHNEIARRIVMLA